MIPQFSQLYIYSPDKSRSTSKIFITSPSLDKELALGRLFGIIEIESPDRALWDTVESLVSEIENDYYGSDNVQLETDRPSHAISVEKTFEHSIQSFNDRLIELIKGGKLAAYVEKLNIIIGVLKDRQLHFAHVGSPKALLAHPMKSNEYRLIDIVDQSGGGQTKVNPYKVIANIVSGELSVGDTVVLCTASLLDYLSLDKIKQTVTTLEPPAATQHLRDLLLEASINTVFAAVVVKLTPTDAEATIKKDIRLPQRSLENLLATEKTTENYLTPPLKFNLKKYSALAAGLLKRLAVYLYQTANQKISQAYQQYQKNKLRKDSELYAEPIKPSPAIVAETTIMEIDDDLDKTDLIVEELTTTIDVQSDLTEPVLSTTNQIAASSKSSYLTMSKNFFFRLGQKIKKTFLVIVDNLQQLFSALISGRQERTRQLKILVNRWLNKLAGYLRNFYALSRPQKIAIVGLAILLALFLQSLIATGLAKQSGLSDSQYQAILTEIADKKTAAESALIYKDETTARSLVAQANDLIAQLPTATRSQRSAIKDLQAQLQIVSSKLQHLTVIDNPEVLIDVSQTIGPADGLIWAKNQLYIYSRQSKRLARFNPTSQEIVDLQINSNMGDIVASALRGDNALLFYHNQNGLSQFDLTAQAVGQGLANLEINLDGQANKIVDLAVYSNRLYVVSPANNQIYRYTPTLTGFGQVQNWIKSDRDLGKVVAMAIDGGIYLLTADGQVQKFVGGQKQNYQLSGLEPALTDPTDIWTDENSDLLYILEPSSQRLIAINKDTGLLQAQYRSDKFSGLTAMAVDQKNNRAFILSDSKLYQISL